MCMKENLNIINTCHMVHPRCAWTWGLKDQLFTMAVDKALSDGRSFGDFALTVLLATEYPWIQNTIWQTADQNSRQILQSFTFRKESS